MADLKDRLERWLPQARSAGSTGYRSQPRLEQIGRVERLGDGIATVSGLPDLRSTSCCASPAARSAMRA